MAATLALPVELTQAQATACAAALRPAVRASSDATVAADASALLRFDSSALAVLLDVRREAAAAGKAFAVRAMPPRLRELARLYGVDRLLPDAA